jgi:subtilisin family serine protease
MAMVRVLAVVPAQAPLRESAAALAAGHSEGLRGRPASLPRGMELDHEFAAVPLARLGYTAQPAMANAADAPRFVVRASVEEAELAGAMSEGTPIFADPRIAAFPVATGCAAGPVGGVEQVKRRLRTRELAGLGLDGKGVAIAIMDTGINLAHLRARGLAARLDPALTWSPGTGRPGQHPVDHGTMCAYDALIAAPEATLLDFPILLSATPGGSAMDGFLSDALQAFGTLLGALQRPVRQRGFRALVVNNSWGMYHPSWDFPAGHPGRYADNPNHPFNIITGTLARAGADVLFAAGNCGSSCPDRRCQGRVTETIMGANAHPDVITVAGCSVARRRVGYSSQGPGIAGMAHAKPDLTAYTHFLGSEAFGTGTEDSGTSAACPVAAGAVAAIRTRVAPGALAPRDLSRELRADARRPSGRLGWNRNYGYGIIDPLATARRLLAV